MPTPSVVPDPNRLDLLSLVAESTHITLIMRTCGDSARCPLCGRTSARVHSHYQRTLADLPWAGIPARILLWTRRFVCDTPDCQRRIFTERLAGVAAPHARCTERLRAWLRHVAFAVGGDPGARLLSISWASRHVVTPSWRSCMPHGRRMSPPPRPLPAS